MFDPTKLPIGAVINCYGDGKEKNIFKRLLMSLVYAAIRAYQKDKYPQSGRVQAVHSILHLGFGVYLNVTAPHCIVGPWQPEAGRKYTAWKWTGADLLTLMTPRGAEAVYQMRLAASKFDGKEYDYLQIFGIGLVKVVEYILRRYLPEPFVTAKFLSYQVLGFGKTRTVCSAGAHAALIAAYKTLKEQGIICDRPLGDQFVEATCPCDFENSPTFTEIPL